MFPTDNILCKVMHGINEYCIASIKYKKINKNVHCVTKSLVTTRFPTPALLSAACVTNSENF
jgi:hypothetical protein